MTRILHIALRDFLAIVATKGFLIGLLLVPALGAVLIILAPSLFVDSGYRIEGEYGVIDPTGTVLPELETALDPNAVARERAEAFRRGWDRVPEPFWGTQTDPVRQAMEEVSGPPVDVRLTALAADMDVEAAKAWLTAEREGARRKALIVIHDDAVEAATPAGERGTYDLYVPPGLDDRDIWFMYRTIREAIINARVAAHSLERAEIEALLRVRRQPSTTVGPDAERRTVTGFNQFLPLAFMVLMFMGILSGGQTMLVSTVEEKSSRVVEVLLSAVSPMELMAGKLLGGVAVSLLTIGLYLAIGLALLVSFSLFGLLDPWLIPYFVIFFLIGFFVIGSLMLAAGAAVNDMREAGQLQAPLMMVVMTPVFFWPAISRSPDSTLAVFLSYLPPVNSFAMLIRMTSTQPPPWWEVWLSIAVGLASVAGAIWIAAKVFRVGLLMYGKPPDLRTLVRWVRAA
ncbi:MAG: ABC transporter permease [Acidobacteria bacterium]|nr:ABC transporter permease [Acidobacteriota bacterium]